jgi:excisionase family DNA binding protein
MMPIMYTKKEVADVLKINQRTLDRLVATGRIIPTRIGRQVRFMEDRVNEFVKSGEA